MVYEALDYGTLKILWWGGLGVAVIGFAIFAGFDLGAATMMPVIAETPTERAAVRAAIGWSWLPSLGWLALALGLLFGAWPVAFATALSALYLPFGLILAALLVRVAILALPALSQTSDPARASPAPSRPVAWALAIASGLIALMLGVIMGNVVQGVPFALDSRLQPQAATLALELFNPFALLTGLVALGVLVQHGAAYLAGCLAGPAGDRARRLGSAAGLAAAAAFLLAGAVLAFSFDGYVIASGAAPDAAADPLAKTIARNPEGWLSHLSDRPWVWLPPAVGNMALLFTATALMRGDRGTKPALFSSLAVAAVIATPALAIFPFLLPSSIAPDASLTIWDAAGSHASLFALLVVAAVMVPVMAVVTVLALRMAAPVPHHREG